MKNRLVPVGFTQELHLWMRAADVLVTKPGPAAILEASAMRLPLVLDHWQTMPQEKPNAAFTQAQGLGLVVSRREGMFDAVASLARSPARLAHIRERMARFGPRDAAGPLLKALGTAMKHP